MTDDEARADIAAIREMLESGRSHAASCGPDIALWGIAVAIGYLGTYAFVRGGWSLSPNWLWAACIGLPWVYSLRGLWLRLAGRKKPERRSPIAIAQGKMWLGLGIFLTLLVAATMWTGDDRQGWLNAVVAGAMGSALFATSWLTGLGWLRWIALAWWGGEILVYALRHQPEALLVSAALMLLLLAAPGVVLARRRQRQLSA